MENNVQKEGISLMDIVRLLLSKIKLLKKEENLANFVKLKTLKLLTTYVWNF